ncbi:uncharacterized protein METZ01_LOCUS468171, partial [marine metagenome]
DGSTSLPRLGRFGRPTSTVDPLKPQHRGEQDPWAFRQGGHDQPTDALAKRRVERRDLRVLRTLPAGAGKKGKSMTSTLKIVVMSVVLSTGLIGAEPPRHSHSVHRASKAPVIDGKLDDACWKKAKPVQAFYPHGENGKKAEPPPLTARYAWDERYFFIGYEVKDSSLVAIGTGKEDGPPNNRRPQSVEYLPKKNLDLVEFFISFGSNRFFWEIHHSADNHLNDLWIEMPTAAELAKIPKPSYKHVTF